ncbi:hypothetical protein LUR56_32260 [Streptomyces sp. MT29]|nr:hypothetical protein [Streptomyces sp. MT29]
MENGVTPLRAAKDRTASLIGRAPWARVDDTPWRDIADGKELVVRGGYRHLEVRRCVPSSEHHCLVSEGAGHCGAIHADWFVPALCLPERKPVLIEDLILRSATGGSVPVYVPSRGSGRAGRDAPVRPERGHVPQRLPRRPQRAVGDNCDRQR